MGSSRGEREVCVLCVETGVTHTHIMVKESVRTGHKAIKSIDKIYNEVPSFADIFDEETWYQFCFMFTMCTIVCVFLLSRYVEIRSYDPLDREHKPRGNVNPRSARQPLGREEIKEE